MDASTDECLTQHDSITESSYRAANCIHVCDVILENPAYGGAYGQRHAKRDLRTYASGQGLYFFKLVTSMAHTFLAMYTIGLRIAVFNIMKRLILVYTICKVPFRVTLANYDYKKGKGLIWEHCLLLHKPGFPR